MFERQGEKMKFNILQQMKFAIMNDEELNKLLTGVSFAHGGAKPYKQNFNISSF